MKKLIAVALVGLTAWAVRADYSYLNWEVSSIDASINEGKFSYAQLYFVLNGTRTAVDNPVLATGVDGVSVMSGTKTDASFANLGEERNWAGYSFLAEAFDDAGASLGISAMLAYEDIAGSISSGTAPGGAAVASFAITEATTPEPTSGLLLLLGVAGLALRRKRA